MDENNMSIWWANKELLEDDMLSKYIGKNEKTTIVVKFSKVFFYAISSYSLFIPLKKGYGAPPRESSLDTETQKAMMAYYYKKQEEHKVQSHLYPS